MSTAQRNYLSGFVNEMESVIYGPNFTDPVNGYAKYIDVDSFIEHHIVVELCNSLLGKNWQEDFINKVNTNGIERVLL
jgi:hypothetical protein